MIENKVTLRLGDCLQELDKIAENSIDSIVTDPPYELNFMGKGWDNAGISFNTEVWQKCLRVLKPGGHLLAFGGSRTFHRIAVAIEDAGFDIRDTIMWLYGSGFPKSMNIAKSVEGKLTLGSGNTKDFKKLSGNQVDRGNWGYAKLQKEQGYRSKDYDVEAESNTYLGQLKPTTDLAKQWQGWGTALKPAFEPIIVARKPFKGSLVDNVLKWGVGGLNIDECRVNNTSADTYDLEKRQISAATGSDNDGHFLDQLHNKDFKHGVTEQGRFPANLILTYEQMTFDEVCGGFPDTKGTNATRHNITFTGGVTRADNSNIQQNNYDTNGYKDSGSAARYFYCAKASKKDRDEGLENFEERQKYYCDGRANSLEIFGTTDGGRKPLKNIHPTVKPTELMQYLIRLVTPNGGTVLDPFMGSGSTGKAAMYENKERNKNYSFIGIEKDPEYFKIAEARINYI